MYKKGPIICKECGEQIYEIYGLTDYAWIEKLGMGKDENLCYHCLYNYIKDGLINIDDFTDAPINNEIKIGYAMADQSYTPTLVYVSLDIREKTKFYEIELNSES